ncbi:MAG: hypothetical protein H6936_14310 [Burkholderiales bacterium]|nr:hypothetical protein [Nitrosomonas sp.]MCP5275991.1 hypothetical protein [Burkholderiales bacterium]
MADKLFADTLSGVRMQDEAAQEKKQPELQYDKEAIRMLLQSAPVPIEFKLSALGVVPKPGLSLAASTDAFAVDDDDDSCAHTPETMRREPAGLPDSSDNTAQPFYLTDAMINLTLLEQVTPGLQSIGGRPLSALITNTCFLEPYIYPPIYWCPKPDKKPCSGMYISYSKQDEKLANDLIQIMTDCGLPVKFESGDQWCGEKRCCNNVKPGTSHRRVTIADRAKVPWHMSRIAAMIDGAIAPPNAKKGKSAFCIAINSKPAAIDWYEKGSPKEDTQFNPLRLPPKGTNLPYRGGSATTEPPGKTFQRRRCDLLAHVIAENFWGHNCYDTFKNYNYAHRLALIEENWIRRATGREEMIWGLDPQNNEWKGLPGKVSNEAGLRMMDKQLHEQCQSFATVTCSNNCPGGRCCDDKVTPFGWQSCKDICKC